MAVGDDRRGMCVLVVQLGQAHLDHMGDLGRCPVGSLDREHDGRAEVDRDAGVHAQLAGGGDVGVVTADDQHGVALLGHAVEPVDDLGDRDIGILVHLLVADPDALVVTQPGRGAGQQQLEDVVAVLAQPGDRAEHPHPRHGRSKSVKDAERNGRLSGVTFGRRNIDRGSDDCLWH